MDGSLSPGLFYCYELHQNMFNSSRRRSWPTKLNPVSSIFAFPQHLRWKPPKRRTDSKERSRKQQKETPQTSRSKKVFTSGKKQDFKPELMDHGSKEEYSAFEEASTPYCQPVHAKCRCPNWLNSLRQSGKQVRELLQTFSKVLCDDSQHLQVLFLGNFHSDKIRFRNRDQHKAAQRSTFVFCRERFYPT